MEFPRRKRPAAGFGYFILCALLFGAAPAFAAAKACNAPVSPPLAVAQLKGVRTKWLSVAPDRRNSIEPDLAHLPLLAWMKDLERVGVNLAEINLEPARRLARRPALSPAQLKETLAAIYTPRGARSPAQRERVSAFENEIAPHWQYTAEERDAVQLDFLRRVNALYRKGEILGTPRFIIHQRLWFRPGDSIRLERNRARRTVEFARDMAGLITLADQHCLGGWIAGIRLGENSNNDMNELPPLIVNLARAVNARTGGWLKTHLFVVNGGGWGAEYRGIDRVRGSDGKPYPFFRDIAAETGAFTFGYKFMQFHRTAPGIMGHMRIAHCARQRFCNPDSVADWREYLGRILGFDDLIAYLKANRRSYPAFANVVFVGDISDAATELVRAEADGPLEDRPAMTALRNLFAAAGPVATSGKIFMNGFNTEANLRPLNYRDGGRVDVGRALYFVGKSGRARLLPQSLRLWKDWPRQ